MKRLVVVVAVLVLACVSAFSEPIEIPMAPEVGFEVTRGIVTSLSGSDYMALPDELKAAFVLGYLHAIYQANMLYHGHDGDSLRSFDNEDLSLLLFMVEETYGSVSDDARDLQVGLVISQAWTMILQGF